MYENTNFGAHESKQFPETMKIGIHDYKYFHNKCILLWQWISIINKQI